MDELKKVSRLLKQFGGDHARLITAIKVHKQIAP